MDYKYVTLRRFAGIGCVPKNGIVSVENAKNPIEVGYYSMVIYSRELSENEISSYELARIDYTKTISTNPLEIEPDAFFLAETDAELKALERKEKKWQLSIVRALKPAIENKFFNSISFPVSFGEIIVTHSTRENGYQFSKLGKDGVFFGHDTFKNSTEVIKQIFDYAYNGLTLKAYYI